MIIKKVIYFLIFFIVLFLSLKTISWATCKSKEKEVFNEFRTMIPADKIKNVDDLYKKWLQIQSGKSKAIIIDVRTDAEFKAGHIINSINIDSGHFYRVPKIIPDPNTEIWVLCRTQHRATYFVGMLYKYGYKNVYLVEGGIKGWVKKGFPLVNKYFGEFKVIKN